MLTLKAYKADRYRRHVSLFVCPSVRAAIYFSVQSPVGSSARNDSTPTPRIFVTCTKNFRHISTLFKIVQK